MSYFMIAHGLASKGFGKEPQTKPKVRSISDTESLIQARISSEKGLREVLDLEKEIYGWKKRIETMTLLDRALIPESILNLMREKEERLMCLKKSWDDSKIHMKLHEITWDADAEMRNTRHLTQKPTEDMNNFLKTVALYTLHAESGLSEGNSPDNFINVLDVGCGTGVIFDYLEKQRYAKYLFDAKSSVGIDLSSKMISIASKNHPYSKFYQKDFLSFGPSNRETPENPREQKNHRETLSSFKSIIFNGSLHNFLNIRIALHHALTLCSSGGRIIISHPKGAANVNMQHATNKYIAPSLLPSAENLVELLSDSQSSTNVIVKPNLNAEHYLAVLAVGCNS